MGIDGLSLRELANRQGIVEGALYKHFKSKEEILQTILDYYTRYDSKIKNTIDNSNMTPKENIIFYAKSFAEQFESDPAMICIVNSFEVLNSNNSIVNRVKEIFISRLEYLAHLIGEGQRDGSIRNDLSGEDLSDIVMGFLRTITLKWRISNYSYPLKERVVSALQLLL